MAKAKKSDSSANSKPASGTAKAPRAKRTSGKSGQPPAPNPSPMINTDLAAASAARMLLARAAGSRTPQPATPQAESAAFKQAKQQATQPSHALDSLLQSTARSHPRGGSHTTPSHGSPNQARTRGPDLSRTGVPRRTNG